MCLTWEALAGLETNFDQVNFPNSCVIDSPLEGLLAGCPHVAGVPQIDRQVFNPPGPRCAGPYLGQVGSRLRS